MSMTDKEKIEELLKNFQKIKANVKVELNKKYREYSLQSASFPKLDDNSGDSKHSDIENHILEKYSVSEELEGKIRIRNIVQASLDSLPPNLRNVISNIYFEDNSIAETARKMGWSDTTIRRRKKKAFRKLKEAGILEAWNFFDEIIYC